MKTELQPGRELDTLIAEMLGWRWWPFFDEEKGWMKDLYPPTAPVHSWPYSDNAPPLDGLPYENCYHFSRMPRFSSDIAAAWEVVEFMRSGHLLVDIACHGENSESFYGIFGDWWEWRCGVSIKNNTQMVYEYADTAPHAICLAALRTAIEAGTVTAVTPDRPPEE